MLQYESMVGNDQPNARGILVSFSARVLRREHDDDPNASRPHLGRLRTQSTSLSDDKQYARKPIAVLSNSRALYIKAHRRFLLSSLIPQTVVGNAIFNASRIIYIHNAMPHM